MKDLQERIKFVNRGLTVHYITAGNNDYSNFLQAPLI